MKRSLPTCLLLLSSAAFAIPQDEGGEPEPRGLRVRTDRAFEGYTLYTPLRSTETFLVDLDGQVVHSWKSEYSPGNSAYLLPEGRLLRCGREEDNPRFRGGGIGGCIEEFDWDGNRLWFYSLATDQQTIHHDIEPLPNGNVLVIAWEYVPRVDAIGMGRDSGAVGGDGFWPDAILEIEPVRPEGGTVVWEWHSYNHLIQDLDESKAFYGSVPDDPGRIDVNADHRDEPPKTAEQLAEEREMLEQMRALGYVGGDEPEPDASGRGGEADWLHTNSIDYHPELDLIAVSTPHLGEVWIIDHSTTSEEAASDYGGRFDRGGRLLYRWGNPRTYGAGEDSDRQLFYQHDARWVPAGSPGEGNLLVSNNGRERGDEDYSSVDELVLPFDSERGFTRDPGAAFLPEAPVWSYSSRDDFNASFISGAERLPNGNTLICDGPSGRLFEVTAEGELAWDYWIEQGGREEGGGRGGRGGRGGPPDGRGGPPDGRGGPPDGRGGPPDGRGGPPDGRGGPPGDPPGGGQRGGPPGGGRGGGRGGGISSFALFRAERIAPDDPRLAGRF